MALKIDKLTPEQEALIPVYREKWRKIALSTERIDREKATEAIGSAYFLIGKSKPQIIFLDSPYAVIKHFKQARKQLREEFKKELGRSLYNQLKKQLVRKSIPLFWNAREYKLENFLCAKLKRFLWQQFVLQFEMLIKGQLKCFEYSIVCPERWICEASVIDFCIDVLSHKAIPSLWRALQLITKECGWVFPFEKICFVCDRPHILKFDSDDRLHAEGEPAIQFADGYSLYAHHGVTLPEQYGKAHPHQWQSKWLLTESNAELRRVLIQGIGYARICQELQAIEIDYWQEYTLLKIDVDADVEPMHLLKMTCPSTGHIHALRVPPAMTTAREAIQWVNWDIDPEAFAVQT